MSPDFTDFHAQLKNYAEASNPQELASKMAARNSSLQNITSSDDVVEKVSNAMNQFLYDNTHQIAASDLPALNRLAGLVKELTSQEPQEKGQSDLRLLARNMPNYINIAVRNARPSFQNCIKDCVLGANISQTMLKETAGYMRERDVIDFVREARSKYDEEVMNKWEPVAFKKMVNLFFQYAHPDDQKLALKKLLPYAPSLDQQDILLTDIISALPENLTHLDLSKCSHLTDKHVKQIANRLTGLQALDLRDCPLLTNRAISAIANSRNMANLQELEFGSQEAYRLDDRAVSALARSENMANLRKLSLYALGGISDQAAKELADSPYITRLETLDFSGCSNLTNQGVMKIAASPNMKNIRGLMFDYCENLDFEAVRAISKSPYITNLQQLYLAKCALTAYAISFMAKSNNFRQLKELSLKECPLLTNEAATVIAGSSTLPSLKYIDFEGCPLITKEVADILHARQSLRKGLRISLSRTPPGTPPS